MSLASVMYAPARDFSLCVAKYFETLRFAESSSYASWSDSAKCSFSFFSSCPIAFSIFSFAFSKSAFSMPSAALSMAAITESHEFLIKN